MGIFFNVPERNVGAFLIQVNTKLFLIGGFNSSSCYECDLSATKVMIWEEKANVTFARVRPFGFHFQDFIYLFGGYNWSWTKRTGFVTGEKYNLKTNQWITLSSQLPCEEFSLAIAVINTRETNQSIYAFVHKNPKQFQAEYNIILNHWSRITLSETDFQSSTSISFPSPSGMYFKYPYIYTLNNKMLAEVFLYKLFDKNNPEESCGRSYNSDYNINLLFIPCNVWHTRFSSHPRFLYVNNNLCLNNL